MWPYWSTAIDRLLAHDQPEAVVSSRLGTGFSRLSYRASDSSLFVLALDEMLAHSPALASDAMAIPTFLARKHVEP